MRRGEIETILGWMGGCDRHDDEDCGMHMRVTLPEPSFKALERHLKLLLEASDPEGMVFEVKDDRLVVDGVEFIHTGDQEQKKSGLLSVVLMRLARMYNIVRMWEGD